MWYQVKFIIDQGSQPRSKAHIDLAILDLVVSSVIASYQNVIEQWRIHRGFNPDHEFKFEAFCNDATDGQNIQDECTNHTFAGMLSSNNLTLSINPSTGGANIIDICEPRWPQEFKEVWPAFAQQQSEIQLKLTQILRNNLPGSPTTENMVNKQINDIVTTYQNIQSQIDTLWQNSGSHAFFHFTHSFFGYAPVQTILDMSTQAIIRDIR